MNNQQEAGVKIPQQVAGWFWAVLLIFFVWRGEEVWVRIAITFMIVKTQLIEMLMIKKGVLSIQAFLNNW